MSEEPTQQSSRNQRNEMTETNETQPTQTAPGTETTADGEEEQPTESPPAGVTAVESEDELAQPTDLPPSEAEEGQAYGAATWHNNKKITALWSNDQNRNSWIYVADLGWRKLADNSDSVVVTLTSLGTHAKQTGATVNLLEDSGKITQMYVWS